MKKVTALRIGKGRSKRVNIFLDGKFGFSLDAEVAARERLRAEQELSTEQIDSLTRDDQCQRCRNAAVQYLSYRPRSETELRTKLHQRGFGGNNIETVITGLKKQALVDDKAFAQFWKENRESFSPRSRWLTGLELKRKGIAKDIIDQVVGAMDDDDGAYRAALSKSHQLDHSDYESFHRRLGDYLKRRGFSYAVMIDTVERIWREQGNRDKKMASEYHRPS